MTEASPLLTMANPKSELATSDQRRRTMQATTGLPVVGTETRVVDAEGATCPGTARRSARSSPAATTS